ncbi:MAG: PEGA domain-containing protein [Planctomycetota bacterium]
MTAAVRMRRVILAIEACGIGLTAAWLWPVGRAADPVPGGRTITVQSEPGGAQLFVNDVFVGRTPRSVAMSIGVQTAITLVKAGYGDVSAALDPAGPAAVRIALVAAPTGRLNVQSIPAGAAVFLDGTLIGKTPLSADAVPAGRHMVRLVRANFMSGIEAVDVALGGVAEIKVTLTSRVEWLYRAAIAGEPVNITLYTELGHYYRIRDRKEEGLREYKRGLEVAANNITPTVLQDAARLLNEIAKFRNDQADVVATLMPGIEKMVEAFRATPARPSALYHDVIRRLRKLGRDDLASRLTDDTVETDSPEISQMRALDHRVADVERRGNKREAFDLHMELARRYATMPGEPVKQWRIEHLRRAANMATEPAVQVRIGLDLAALYRETGDGPRAEEVLLKTRTLLTADQVGSDLFWETADRLVGYYQTEKMPEKAREIYQSIIRDHLQPAIQDRARQELGKL